MATTDNWIGSASADWGASAANWHTGFPNSGNNVVIKTATVLTVSYDGADTYVVNSLAVGSDFFDMFGGSLTILTTASFGDGFTQTGGTLTVGGKVTIAGTGTLTGGAAEGNTAFSITGTTAIGNFYTLGGATVLNNVKTTNQTGQITLGDITGIDATINNEKGATFNIAGDYGIGQGAATASFVNAGALEKTGGSNTSAVAVNITDTGTIAVNAPGTLLFDGPSNSFAGAISGEGQFAIGAGSSTIAVGTTITTGSFGIDDNGTLVTLGGNLSYAHNFSIEIGAILDLAGHTLTLSGTNTFGTVDGQPAIDGAGTLVTAKASTAGINEFTLGGSVDWQNSGTVRESTTFEIGDGSANAAIFTNETGGVYALTNDNGIARGAAANSSFVNSAGATLEKAGGSGNSIVFVDVINKGAITVSSGIIEFAGPNNTVAGAVSGAGEFALGDGSDDTLSGGISTAIFVITDSGTLVTLGKSLSYAHNFTLQNGAILDLGSFTLTLSGTDTFVGYPVPTLDGSGVLVTKAGGTASVSNFTLGGSVNWQNSGIVLDGTGMTLGDTSFNTATFTNEKSGVFEFTTSGGIARGGALNSSFVNLAGATVENTGGGDSIIGANVVDTGAVTVATGTIEFAGINNSVAGAVTGAGEFDLGGGSNDNIGSGGTIASTTFVISDSNTLVTLGENLTYTRIFDLQNQATLDLGGFTLTLSGTDTFSGSPTIDGTGKLITATGSNAGVNNLTLGGQVNWQNSGTVSEQSTLTIGDGSFDVATFANEKGGTYDFTNNNGIALNGIPTSIFVNLAGATMAKIAGSGDSQVAPLFTNNGAVTVAAGTIEFDSAVTGNNGKFTIDPGTFLQFDAAVTAVTNDPRVVFATKTGGELVLNDSQQFGGAIFGFGGTNTDELDLRDINFGSTGFKLIYSGSTTQGVLGVTDGTNVADLTMFGNYKTANFHPSADGFGGTRIFDPPSHPTLLASAHQ